MSSIACACNVGLSNTGQGNCVALPKVTKKLIFLSYFNTAGDVNGIPLSPAPTLDKAYFQAKINNANTDLRWYPTPKTTESVADERADPIQEQFDSGLTEFVQEGKRTFSAVIPGASTALIKHLKGLRCIEAGVYMVDKEKNLVGTISEAGKFNPFRIVPGSVMVVPVQSGDTTVSKVRVSFQFDDNEKDEDVRIIPASSMSYDLLTANGLIDLSGVIDNEATTGFTIELGYDSGNALEPAPVKGLVAADFSLKNAATNATITITSVNESPAGKYTFVVPTQTTGVNMILGPSITRFGYDFSHLDKIVVP